MVPSSFAGQVEANAIVSSVLPESLTEYELGHGSKPVGNPVWYVNAPVTAATINLRL
jgi:hypothetical protein